MQSPKSQADMPKHSEQHSVRRGQEGECRHTGEKALGMQGKAGSQAGDMPKHSVQQSGMFAT